MRIAILGGTGDIGEGLTLRLGRDTDHAVVVGSRDADRAAAAVDRYRGTLRARGYDPAFDSGENADAVVDADIVVASVPPYTVADTVEAVAEDLAEDCILVSPAVGMRSDDAGQRYHRPGVGSVTAVAAQAAPTGVHTVGAFHTVPADRLADLDDPLEMDTVVVGDDADARGTVRDLAGAVDGLRALDGGPLANATELEGVTPLLINLARYNESLDHAGFRAVGDAHRGGRR